jgi:hypothetical protein
MRYTGPMLSPATNAVIPLKLLSSRQHFDMSTSNLRSLKVPAQRKQSTARGRIALLCLLLEQYLSQPTLLPSN